MGVPGILAAIDIRQQDRMPWTELAPGTTGRELVRLIDNPQGGTYDMVAAFSMVNLYSCVGYIPSGGAIWAGRLFGTSPLTQMYLGRFANLATYIMLVFLALRLLPDFRLPLLVLAVMPMSLHQAASLSIDAIGIALSVLLSAYILRLAFSKDVPRIDRRHHLALIAGIILLALCKASVGLVLLVLLIPAAKFSSRRGRWVAFTGYVFLALGTMVVWQYANRSNGEIFATLRGLIGVHAGDSLFLMLRHPFEFLGAVGRTLLAIRWDLLQEFVGKLGWLDIRLPWWIVVTYPVVLVVAAAAPASRVRLSGRNRATLAAIFVINIVAVFALVGATWDAFVPNSPAGIISGVQGRYLIPFTFPLLVAMAGGMRVRVRYRPLAVAGAAFIVVVHMVALGFVWKTFQTRTSTIPNRLRMAFHMVWTGSPAMRYQGRLVSLHGMSGQEQPMFLVDRGARHLLEDRNWMVRNGYSWPDDVVFIRSAELETIPMGDPLRRPARGRSQAPTGRHVSDDDIKKQEAIILGGNPGDIAVVGDWNGDGRSKKGVYNGGTWWLDWDGDGHHTIVDKVYHLGGLAGDIPVTGDWNGDGRSKIGVFRAGFWVLDFDGNGAFEEGKDVAFSFGGMPGDIPVVGDWSADGRTKVGVFRLGRLWVLDANGNRGFDGTGPGKDIVFPFGGIAGDLPVVGDWSGEGKSNVGLFRHDHYWILDMNGNGNFDGTGPGKDRAILFGMLPGDIPVVGDWNGDGKTKIGVFRKGRWILDVDGSGREDSVK
jgi:uncharacterized membrane protein